MSQLSFFSAESVPPAIADLSGILAAPGQVVLVGGGESRAARLSVVVDRLWRAEALAAMIDDAGLRPEIARTDENSPLVRTAADVRLAAMAAEWTRGAVKTVPPQWLPGPRELRSLSLCAGSGLCCAASGSLTWKHSAINTCNSCMQISPVPGFAR